MHDVAHIGIVVKNVDKSLAFYTSVLGCTRAESYQDERIRLEFIKSGQQTIELIQYTEDAAGSRGPGIVDHVAFLVKDMDDAIARLRQNQVPLLFDQPKIMSDKKIMFFTGPDGERLEFVQKL